MQKARPPDRALAVTPARHRHSETSDFSEQSCSSAEGEGPTTLPNTALANPFLGMQAVASRQGMAAQHLSNGEVELVSPWKITYVTPPTSNISSPTNTRNSRQKRQNINFLYQKPMECCQCQVLFRCRSQKLICQLLYINLSNICPMSATFILNQWLNDFGLLLFKDSANRQFSCVAFSLNWSVASWYEKDKKKYKKCLIQ